MDWEALFTKHLYIVTSKTDSSFASQESLTDHALLNRFVLAAKLKDYDMSQLRTAFHTWRVKQPIRFTTDDDTYYIENVIVL